MKKKSHDEVEEKIEEKQAEPKDGNEIRKDVLVYLRDNVVHGNDKHVQMINNALNS